MFDLVSDWPLRTSSRRAFAALRQAPLAIGLATLLWLVARGAGLFVLASFVPAAQAAPRPELPGDLFASQPTEVQGALRFLCGTVFLVVLWTLAAWADAGFLRVVLDALRTPRRASLRPFLQPGSAFGRMLAYHVASGLLVFGAGLVVVSPRWRRARPIPWLTSAPRSRSCPSRSSTSCSARGCSWRRTRSSSKAAT